jgi:hypothetical protein
MLLDVLQCVLLLMAAIVFYAAIAAVIAGFVAGYQEEQKSKALQHRYTDRFYQVLTENLLRDKEILPEHDKTYGEAMRKLAERKSQQD